MVSMVTMALVNPVHHIHFVRPLWFGNRVCSVSAISTQKVGCYSKGYIYMVLIFLIEELKRVTDRVILIYTAYYHSSPGYYHIHMITQEVLFQENSGQLKYDKQGHHVRSLTSPYWFFCLDMAIGPDFHSLLS